MLSANRFPSPRSNSREPVLRTFVALDATRIEVDPLALLPDGHLAALGASLAADDNALFRQPALPALQAEDAAEQTEGVVPIGESAAWRRRTRPTSFATRSHRFPSLLWSSAAPHRPNVAGGATPARCSRAGAISAEAMITALADAGAIIAPDRIFWALLSYRHFRLTLGRALL